MIPYPVAGFKYLGQFVILSSDGTTSSYIHSLYERNSDKKLFTGWPGNTPWQIKLEEADNIIKKPSFVKFVPF